LPRCPGSTLGALSVATVRSMQHGANTLLLTSRYSGVRRLTFDPKRGLLVALGSISCLCGTLLYGGFRLGVNTEIGHRLDEVAHLQGVTRQQQEVLQRTRTLAEDNLDALALRLGRMQAQLLRINSLGDRLATRAELDTPEFDFSQPPALGGPATSTTATRQVPDFLAELDLLDTELNDRARKLRMLQRLLMIRDLDDRVTPSGLPVDHGALSSGFGVRTDPFTGHPEQHNGVDVAARAGSPVLAVADGIVIWAGERSGYGKLVEIDHGNGYITRYGHNRELLTRTGRVVHKGDPIAQVGSTGRSTGPHVHLEVLHDGKAVNPARFLDTANTH
jgi:murein DD-endopeptidase MepM/ murein hydrolase activator NlpD